MVRVRGFEPPTSAFQVRSSGLSELHPVELAFPTGIEPACLPVRSRALVQLSYGKNWCDVWDSNPCCCAENADAWPLAERRMIGSGRRIRTCRILINSQAHPPRTVDRNELVDRLGVEPSASCLQGISPPRRPAQRKRVHARLLENGARTWFRATLSCSSGRRFHQISFPSVRPARIELASSEWHSEALPIDQGRMVGNRGIEPRVPKAQVLQTRSVTRLGITRIWLQGSEPMPLPAPSVYKTAPVTRPVHSPCWSSRQDSNLHPSAPETDAHPVELRDGGLAFCRIASANS
jgi:hypothetical protein